MEKGNIILFYNLICKDLKIDPVPIKFTNVSKGGASISHNGKGLIYSINIDLKRCHDVEYGLYHEIAHQVCILKNNNFSHNSTFKKINVQLNEKYMYSKCSEMLYI